jgi:hypothetical protein
MNPSLPSRSRDANIPTLVQVEEDFYFLFFCLNSKTFCEEAIQQIRSSPSPFSVLFCCFFSFLIFLLSGYSRFGCFFVVGLG